MSLVHPLGFITPTAARRITYQDSLVFHRIHQAVYRQDGYELVDIPPATVTERTALVEKLITPTAPLRAAAQAMVPLQSPNGFARQPIARGELRQRGYCRPPLPGLISLVASTFSLEVTTRQ